MEIEGFSITHVAHIQKLLVDPHCMALFTIICIILIVCCALVMLFHPKNSMKNR